ncbi:MAG: GntR family transcriptional regulator [Pseudomonadota bacterium]
MYQLSDLTPPAAPSPMPLYRQISDLLVREIDAGRILDGERLDPERTMAARLGTSVGTLRKALAYLQDQGLLERRQGSGNYVRRANERETVYSFFRIELLSGGGAPTARVLSVRRTAKPDHAPEFGTSREAYRIRRLRLLDDVPAVVEEIWLDADTAPHLTADMLSHSLYATYKNALGIWITRAVDKVSIGNAPDFTPADFGVSPGAFCGRVERLSFAQTGLPVEWSISHFDPAVAQYVQRLK